MPQINLLPWRTENLMRCRQNLFLLLAAVLLGVMVIIAMFHITLQDLAHHKENQNILLATHLQKINATLLKINSIENQKKNLVAKIETIHELQRYQSHIIYFLSSIVRSVPQGVLLTNIKNSKDSIAIAGKADTNDNIALLMRNLILNKLGSPVLTEIKTLSNQQEYTLEFMLVLNQEWSGRC